MSQQLVLMGTFFVLPVYLQVVLGFDAFETGKRLLPMSITMLAAALTGPKLVTRSAAAGDRADRARWRWRSRRSSWSARSTSTLNETGFKLSLALFGVGAGLLMSQLGNVIMSSAPPGKTNEAGGLQGTAQNLGASLGTALIGSVLLTGLLTGFNDRIAENPALSDSTKTQISAATENGIEIVTAEQVHAAVIDAGATPAEADAITADYSDAELDALKKAMLAVALLALALDRLHAAAAGQARDPARPRGCFVRVDPALRTVRSRDGRDRRRRPREDVREGHAGARRHPLLGPRGRGLRPARAERRRQVDDRPHPRDADAAPTRVARSSRATTSPRRPARCGARSATCPRRRASTARRPGSENLVLQGRLQGMRGADLERRAADLLETFGLADKANALVKTYSGGHEAPARRRDGPRPPAAGAVPRRADDGARPRGARRDVGRARAPRAPPSG